MDDYYDGEKIRQMRRVSQDPCRSVLSGSVVGAERSSSDYGTSNIDDSFRLLVSNKVEENNFPNVLEREGGIHLTSSHSSDTGQAVQNEALLDGFALLRIIQLLNFDVYYVGLSRADVSYKDEKLNAKQNSSSSILPLTDNSNQNSIVKETPLRKTILDELAECNPLQKHIDRHPLLGALCKYLKICLSIVAILTTVDKTLSTILLCLLSRLELDTAENSDTSNSSMSWFVLVLVNLSSLYILFSTVFNGHLLWNLLSQRLFLVSRRFQYKTMLSLIVFIYLEYIINISFVNNLYGWNLVTNTNYGSYSVLSRLKPIVTLQDEKHLWLDILLTFYQFARGVIRISPYITINYAIICLKEHIRTIRNQNLLTESLKKRQKLRLVVTSKQRNSRNNADEKNFGSKKKHVIFATQTSERLNSNSPSLISATPRNSARQVVGMNDLMIDSTSDDPKMSNIVSTSANCHDSESSMIEKNGSNEFSYRIHDFDELESHITNLYIFTGRLNRLMSKQGLAMFFIVHNLVISCTLIVPEAVRGGPPMAQFIRLLVIGIAAVPFFFGQRLNKQLERLSKQIDRIIIKQQFIGHRRDNLVRIRELLHDIRVNCGGMLNFNVETGIKYLVVALACAFFIEQEDYKLTRRH